MPSGKKGKKVSKKVNEDNQKSQNQKRSIPVSQKNNKRKQKPSKKNQDEDQELNLTHNEEHVNDGKDDISESPEPTSETSETKELNGHTKSEDDVESGEEREGRTSSPEEENAELSHTQKEASILSRSKDLEAEVDKVPTITQEPKPLAEPTQETAVLQSENKDKEGLNYDDTVDSEEEKKASGEDEEEGNDSDSEIKQSDLPNDFPETTTIKQSPPSYTSRLTALKQKAKDFIPSLPTLPHSFQKSIPSISTFTALPHDLYTSVSAQVKALGSKARNVFATSHVTDSETLTAPSSSWLSQLVIHLKFLFLAIFYLHFGLWALISILLIGINVCSFFFGPWAVFPIGGWGVGLYLHLIATSYLLQASGASTKELSWVENPLHRALGQVKGLTHTAREVALHKYQDLCQSWRCQGAR